MRRSDSRGFTLIEILVGLTLGLLATLAIMTVYTTFEAQKRQTTSGGDAQTNGSLGLYIVERDARQAGMGFSNIDILGCKLLAYDSRRTPTDFALSSLVPLVINPAYIPAGDANTDVVHITFGDATGLTAGVPFTQPSGSSANYKVSTSRSGFTVSEFIIAAEPGKDCTLAQVTELPASGSGLCSSAGAGGTDEIIHNNGNYKDPTNNCANTESYWNKPGGLGVTYSNGKLYDLGKLPKSSVYAVRNGKLTVCDYLNADCEDATKVADTAVWVPLYDGVVSLLAQYGRDTSSPLNGIDTFDQTTPTTACGWASVSAARLAIVGRSRQYEKTEVTTTSPSWQGGSIDLSGLPDWKHYRYRLFESTVPLRNIVWMDKSSC